MEWDELAEVVYQDDEVLVVNVARTIQADAGLENALVDTLARHEQRAGAQSAIDSIARDYGLHAHAEQDGARLALTLAPPSAASQE